MGATVWSPNDKFLAESNATGTVKQEQQVAIAGQTIFNLVTFAFVANTGSLTVYKNGKILTRTEDYVEVSNVGIVLTAPATVGDEILFVGFVGITGNALIDSILRADLLNSSGSAIIGYILGATGSRFRSIQEKLREDYSVFDFMTQAEVLDALAGTQLLNHTASIQEAIDWGVLNGGNLIFPYAKYNVTKLQVKDVISNFSVTMDNCYIFGMGLSAENAIFEVVNCVGFNQLGACTIHAQNSANYTYGHFVKVQAGTSQSSTRINIYNVTVRNAKEAFGVGEYNVDFQCSELAYYGCNAFACPIALRGGGSQTGASFIGCNLVAETNVILGGPLKSAIFEGGFFYISGGELVQTINAAGNCAIEVRPCQSVTYGNPYAIVKVGNAHIESSAVLLLVNNPRGLATPYSLLSSIAFSNVSGYIPSAGVVNVVDSTGDNSYAGKIAFNNGTSFYGDTGVNRAVAHIYLGTNTVLDIDGTPFGQSFLQGLSGISSGFPGKPRLRGETIVAMSGAVTSIATAAAGGTIVNYPTIQVTQDSGYGSINYAAGAYTAPQAMKDVQVNFQVAFATAAANADVWIAINGAAALFASKVGDTVKGGTYVIPVLAAGDVITIRANTNTGASILLTGGTANFLRINART